MTIKTVDVEVVDLVEQEDKASDANIRLRIEDEFRAATMIATCRYKLQENLRSERRGHVNI